MADTVSFGGKTLEIKGIKEAQKILEEIAQKYEGGEIPAESFQDVATPTLDLINAQTPVKTGNLVTHNEYELLPDGIRFFNEVEYAGFVHDGTSRMPARPFMRDGLNYLASIFPQIYTAKMTQAVNDAVSRNIK